MENKHLSSVKIENYKRFNSLEINNLGQFNLVVGDNNTGKTCLLEALCLCNPDMDAADAIVNLYYHCLMVRGISSKTNQKINRYNTLYDSGLKHECFFQLTENFDIIVNDTHFKNLCFNYSTGEKRYTSILSFFNPEIYSKYGNATIPHDKHPAISSAAHSAIINNRIGTNDIVFELELDNQPHKITFSHIYEKRDIIFANYLSIIETVSFVPETVEVFSKITENSRTDLKQAISLLRLFIAGIEDLRVTSREKLVVYENDKDKPYPLSAYGLGSNKLFNILIEFFLTPEGGVFMIDEVDAGIHYRRFKEFWRGLLRLAIKKNVQLFAATHNIECIEFFRQVLLEEEFAEYQKEARIITLRQRLKDPETVYSETHTFEDMEYAHQTELDLRGGQWV